MTLPMLPTFALEKRRSLMEAWAPFCTARHPAKVVTLAKRAKSP